MMTCLLNTPSPSPPGRRPAQAGGRTGVLGPSACAAALSVPVSTSHVPSLASAWSSCDLRIPVGQERAAGASLRAPPTASLA